MYKYICICTYVCKYIYLYMYIIYYIRKVIDYIDAASEKAIIQVPLKLIWHYRRHFVLRNSLKHLYVIYICIYIHTYIQIHI